MTFDLVITSGVGPTEARHFVHQLATRLEQLAEQRGLEVREVVSHGDAGAPRSVRIRLAGDVTAQLAAECGTHVLVHRSAHRGRSSRKRWFAAVMLHEPTRDPADADVTAIPPESLVITTCRASGPGGQHVNKVSSAVRVQHVPSGLTIRCAGSRSQKQNLDRALRRLVALLRERAEACEAAEAASRRDAHYRVERGRPIRTYHLATSGVLVEAPTREAPTEGAP